jgi:putative ABC transport system permease protein
MDALLQGIRYAARNLRRNRRLSVVIVLTLALVIGANTVVFSAVRALILEPFPFRDGDRLVMISSSIEECPRCDVSPADFLDWRDGSTSFEHVAAYRWWPANLSGPDVADRTRGYQVSTDLLTALGAEAALGRTFLPGEDRPGENRVTVLSHDLWSTRFGADPSIVGQEVRISGEPYRVVGVLRRDHGFPAMGDLWVPLELTPAQRAVRGSSFLGVVARMRPGVRIEEARAEMAAVADRIAHEHPATNAGRTAVVSALQEITTEGPRPYLFLLMGAVAFLLLIACTNLANLTLVHATTRRQELAVRAALGAGRGRITRQLLTETLLLALIGGVAGALLAVWGTELLRTAVPEHQTRYVAGWSRIGVDTTVLAFTLGVTVLTGVLFGLLPAWNAARPDLTSSLKDGARGSSGGRAGRQARRVLVVAEIALALVLLAGTGLMVQSLARMLRMEGGFRTDRILTVQVSLPATHPEGAPVAEFLRRAMDRVGSLPGVERVAAVNQLPMNGDDSRIAFAIEGLPEHSGERLPRAGFRVVTPDYFASLEIPVLRGRSVSERDVPDAPPVVVVNQTLVERFFPDADPVGRRLVLAGQEREIVGVVADVRHLGPRAPAHPEVFLPHAQSPARTMALVVRTTGDPLAAGGAVRREIGAVDPDAGVENLLPMERIVAEFLFPERVTTAMLGIFALIALLISAVGIYGVMSHSVAQRTREMGLRSALGARRDDLLRLVLGQSLALTLGGVVVGLVGAVALTRLMASMLYDVSASDPVTLIGVASVLVVVAVLASYLPARRASRADPMVALRSD